MSEEMAAQQRVRKKSGRRMLPPGMSPKSCGSQMKVSPSLLDPSAASVAAVDVLSAKTVQITAIPASSDAKLFASTAVMPVLTNPWPSAT